MAKALITLNKLTNIIDKEQATANYKALVKSFEDFKIISKEDYEVAQATIKLIKAGVKLTLEPYELEKKHSYAVYKKNSDTLKNIEMLIDALYKPLQQSTTSYILLENARIAEQARIQAEQAAKAKKAGEVIEIVPFENKVDTSGMRKQTYYDLEIDYSKLSLNDIKTYFEITPMKSLITETFKKDSKALPKAIKVKTREEYL